ncbi:MAG: hypothetical protein HZB48_07685, partial [Actinobacteria bacterium]|nr:hypothetical protein [Actinomycetota bacterium]
MKRSLSTRRIAVALGLAVTFTCFAPSIVAAAEPGDDLRAPLSTSPVWTDVIAASGTSILADGGSLRLSTDNGQTWAPAAVAVDDDTYLESVDSGKAVFLHYTNDVDVLDMASNKLTRSVVSLLAGDVITASPTTALTIDRNSLMFSAVGLSSGEVTPLSDQWIEELPSGFDSNDEVETYAVVGGAGAAIVTRFILDSNPSDFEIDPLPLNGGTGANVFRVHGFVPYVGVVGDRLEYVKKVSTAVSLCSLPMDGTAAQTCKQIATLSSSSHSVSAQRSGNVLLLTLNNAEYIWEANALKKVGFTGSYASWGA